MHLPLTPLRFLFRAIDQYGDKEGVVSGDDRFTYRQFGERCLRFASALVQVGVRRGEIVAYLGFNSHQLLESYYSIPSLGAIFAPINARLVQPEIVSILNHCQAACLIVDTDSELSLAAIRASCPSLRTIISLQPREQTDYTYEQLLAGVLDPGSMDWTIVDETEIAQVFFTSGTSGQPKGVMHSHRSLYLHALTTALFYNQRDIGTELYPYQLFHANGWGRPHTATMLGLKQVLMRYFRPREALHQIQREGVTHVGLVPTMAEDLLTAASIDGDYPKLTQITLGGAISTPDLIQRLEERFHCRCVTGYGLTESGPVVASSFLKNDQAFSSTADTATRKAMAGWPIVGSEMRIVDRQFNDVSRGTKEVGRIVVRSDSVMEGYWGDPTGTQETFVDGWLLTGDLGTWDVHGYIQVVDREKDVIVSGGENISSVELESEIERHPFVQECAVIAAPHQHWGETPLAIVVLKQEQKLSAGELAAYLRIQLASFKIPGQWQFTLEPLPRTDSGKLKKSELRQRYVSEPGASARN